MRRLVNTVCLWALIPFMAFGFDGFGFLPYTRDHMDIAVRLEDGELVGFWDNDFATINGQIDSAPTFPAAGLRALGVFDEATPPLSRPVPAQWDFLGVAAGEPIYILPAGGEPNTLPYLGLNTEHDSLGSLGADQFRFILVDMIGPGDGVFSLHVGASVQINTLAGFPAGSVLIETGDHLHYNWSFSLPGTYDLYFEFEALSDGSVVATGSDMFRFQITTGGGFDDYEHWRRTVFNPDQITDESISGPNATPLNDGISNMQRFAFGDDASVEMVWIEENGDFFPGIRSMMRQDSGMDIAAEYATQLVPPDWNDADVTLQESESIFHDPGMEWRTYRINHTNMPTGFFRLHSVLPAP